MRNCMFIAKLIAAISLTALLLGCESTQSNNNVYQASQAYKPNQINIEMLCQAQKATCDSSFKMHWSQIKSALLPNRLTGFMNVKPAHYLTQSSLIYWGHLNRVERFDCPINSISCAAYTRADLAMPYHIKQYNQSLLGRLKSLKAGNQFSFITHKVEHIIFTKNGHCKHSGLGTSQRVCAYINGPSLAEQAGVTKTTKQNPYRSQTQLSGDYALFHIEVINNKSLSSNNTPAKLSLQLALPGNRQFWQNASWAKIRNQLHKAVFVL